MNPNKNKDLIEHFTDPNSIVVLHKLFSPEQTKTIVNALENQGCGCGICLAHNGMRCPKLNKIENEMPEVTYATATE